MNTEFIVCRCLLIIETIKKKKCNDKSFLLLVFQVHVTWSASAKSMFPLSLPLEIYITPHVSLFPMVTETSFLPLQLDCCHKRGRRDEFNKYPDWNGQHRMKLLCTMRVTLKDLNRSLQDKLPSVGCCGTSYRPL